MRRRGERGGRAGWAHARLEPVNLAAIAEHAEAAQRDYLDAQDTDLTAGAGHAGRGDPQDRPRTRGRFSDTFDRVNAGVQELYPRCSAAAAYLELTGEDLLDTGVSDLRGRPASGCRTSPCCPAARRR